MLGFVALQNLKNSLVERGEDFVSRMVNYMSKSYMRDLAPSIFEESNDAIFVVDPQSHVIIDVNPSAQRLARLSRAQLVGMKVVDLFQTRDGQRLSASHIADWNAANVRLRRMYTLNHGDSESIPVDLCFNYIRKEFSAVDMIISNVPRRGFPADSHQEAEKPCREVVEQADDMIQVVRDDGSFIRVNPAWHRILGYSVDDVNLLNLFDIVHPDDRALCREVMDDVFTMKNSAPVKLVLRAADGRSVALGGHVDCGVENGSRASARFLLHDIRDSKQNLQHVARSARRLEKGNDRPANGETKNVRGAKENAKSRLARESVAGLVASATSDGVWQWDLTTNEIHLHDNWYSMTGYQRGDFDTVIDSWKALIHPDDVHRTLAAVQRYLDGIDETYECEYRLLTKDRGWCWILDRGKIMEWDAAGKPIVMVGADKDIDEKKRSALMMEGYNKTLEQFAAGESLESILNTLALTLETQIDDMAAAILPVDGSGLLQRGVAPSLPESYGQKLQGLKLGSAVTDDPFFGNENRGRSSENNESDSCWSQFHQITAEHQLTACWSQPVISNEGEVLAVLVVYFDQRRKPTDDEIPAIKGVANLIRIAISRQHDRIRLTESEQRFRAVFESSRTAIFVADAKSGTLVDVNQAAAELMDLPKHQFVGMHQSELHPPEEAERYRQLFMRHTKTGGIINEVLYVQRRNGDRIPVEIHASNFEIAGRAYIQGVFYNLTRRQRIETSLRKSEEKLRLVTDAMPAFIGYLNADETYGFVNAQYEKLFDLPRDEIIGRRNVDLLGQDAYRRISRYVKAALSGRRVKYEIDVDLSTLGSRTLAVEYVPDVSADGRVQGYYSLAIDITDRKNAEASIRAVVEGTAVVGAKFFQSFAKHLAGAMNVRYVLVCLHLDNPVTKVRTLAFWSGDELKENIEYELAGGPCAVTARGEWTFYPEGIQAQFAADTDLVAMEAESYCGIPMLDSNGRIMGHLAMIDDRPMTSNLCERSIVKVFVARAAAEMERIINDRKLHTSESRIRSIIEAIPVCVKVLDAEGMLLDMNATGLSLIEADSLESVRGKCVFDFIVEEHRDEFIHATQESFQGTPTEMEFEIIGLKGTRRWMQTRSVPLADPSGIVRSVLAVTRDISEDKRTEKMIRRHREEMAEISRLSNLGQMSTGIAHELNQPLTAMSMFASASLRDLKGGKVDVEILANDLAAIADQSVRAGEVIQSIRKLVGAKRKALSTIDINETIWRALGLIDIEFMIQADMMEFQPGADLPMVRADDLQLQQALINLIRNALEATVHQKNPKPIVIRTRVHDNETILVEVEDFGDGFAGEILATPFKAFATTKESGMGLGMSISKTIIENHGGTIWIKNKRGGGALVSFTLPIRNDSIR